MTAPTYTSQSQWSQIQNLLPSELHFDDVHKPVEEWWSNRGHNIHLDRWRNPAAKVRVILHHGVGTNGRQMSLILGVPLVNAGFEAVAIDMPNYGMTQVAPHAKVTYAEWVEIANDFINSELKNDPRPIVLYGLSAGGLLTYHVAALNKKVKGIIGMTFIDQRLQQVRDETCRNHFMSRVGVPMAHLSAKTPFAGLTMPMAMVSKMWALCNDEAAMKIFMSDKTSAGAWTSMRFMSSYMGFTPALEPEQFDVCPILLTQPMDDKWTPLHLSTPFLDRITKVPVKIVELEGTGHYPVEKGGAETMRKAIISFLKDIEASL